MTSSRLKSFQIRFCSFRCCPAVSAIATPITITIPIPISNTSASAITCVESFDPHHQPQTGSEASPKAGAQTSEEADTKARQEEEQVSEAPQEAPLKDRTPLGASLSLISGTLCFTSLQTPHANP